MEYILNSNNHKITNDCLRYDFKNPIRFNNQKISLMSMVFYDYFENITDKFYMSVKHINKIITIRFQYGSYNVSVINQIIDDYILEKFNITEKPINKYQSMLIDMLF